MRSRISHSSLDDLSESESGSLSRESFSLKAFSEMSDTRCSSIIPQDLYKNPTSVVELSKGPQQTSDDTVIKRMTMGKLAKSAAFDSTQLSTSTTPRRPNDKYYMCPSNTFIASNGDVYEIEPFMLPPPTEIAALFKELKNRRDRSDSNLSDGLASKFSGKGSERIPRSPLLSSNHKLPRNISFDSTCSDANPKSEHKTFQENSIPFGKKSYRGDATESKFSQANNLGNGTGIAMIEEDDSVDENSKLLIRENNVPRLRLGKRYHINDIAQPPPEKPESSIGAYPSLLHTDQPKNKEDDIFNWESFSLKKYLLTEMLGIGEAGHLQPAAVGNMQNFLTVPSKVEKFIVFGFFICVDAFLYVITFLPIRVAYSLYLLTLETFGVLAFMTMKSPLEVKAFSEGGNRGTSLKGLFHRSHLYDLMRGAFMVLSCYVLMQLNMSRVYHYIRGQTLIKLYVLTAMLEIFDKLLCSFGQDAFDSLYCITRMRPDPRSIFFSFIVTAVYTTLHSGLYFMLIATLTVAINSADQALVTVLVLNNFAEIKSFVFKKFDKQNLFQLSCSDITERFQLVLFLLCISGVALAQAGAAWSEIFPTHVFVIALMVTAEAIADWIKHAFISKFNHISANVYDDFARVLRKDVLNCHKDKVILDQTYAITKRVGLAQIPLGCVSLRYLMLALSSPSFQAFFATKSSLYLLLLFFFWFSVLVVSKIAIGLGLVRYAGLIHNKELALKAAEESANSNGSSRFERKISMNQLSNIERYTVWKGRVVG